MMIVLTVQLDAYLIIILRNSTIPRVLDNDNDNDNENFI